MSRPEKSLETKLAEIDRQSAELGAALAKVPPPSVHECPSCLPKRRTLIPVGQALCDACQRGIDEQREHLAALTKESLRHRSGTQWSEKQMAARYDTIKLRLPMGYKDRLLAICEHDAISMSEWVAGCVDAAEAEALERAAKKRARR